MLILLSFILKNSFFDWILLYSVASTDKCKYNWYFWKTFPWGIMNCVSFFFLKLLMSLLGKPYMVFVNFESMYRSLHQHRGGSPWAYVPRGHIHTWGSCRWDDALWLSVPRHRNHTSLARYVLNRLTITAFYTIYVHLYTFVYGYSMKFPFIVWR